MAAGLSSLKTNEDQSWPFSSFVIFSILFGSIASLFIVWQNLKRLGKTTLSQRFFLKGGLILLASSFLLPMFFFFTGFYPLKEALGSFIIAFYPFWFQPLFSGDSIICLGFSVAFPLWLYFTQLKKEKTQATKFTWSILPWGLLGFFITILLVSTVNILKIYPTGNQANPIIQTLPTPTISPEAPKEVNVLSPFPTESPKVYTLKVNVLKKRIGLLRYNIAETLGICPNTNYIDPCASFYYDSTIGKPDNKNRFTLYLFLKQGQLAINRIYKDEFFEITVSPVNPLDLLYLQGASLYCQKDSDCFLRTSFCTKGAFNKFDYYMEAFGCEGQCDIDEEFNSEKNCCQKIFAGNPYCKNNQCQIDYTINTTNCRKIEL